jgi:hypothetical protein
VRVATVLPAGTVTLPGTVVTRILLVANEITAPPLGAWLLSVTVPVTDVPPATSTGLTDRDDSSVVAVILSAAVLLTPLYAAVIVAVAAVVPVVVVTAKVAVVLPAATVTEAGTTAAALLLDNATETPPLGAAALSVIVPVEEVPRATLVGFRETLASAAGAVMVRVAVELTPL